MKLLLDTNVIIYWLNDINLTPYVRDILMDVDNTVYISSISIFEIQMKKAAKRLAIADKYFSILKESSFSFLPLHPEHAISAADLPLHHKDPFDRILIAQTQSENAVLITSDKALSKYNVGILQL